MTQRMFTRYSMFLFVALTLLVACGSKQQSLAATNVDAEFTLKTALVDGRMAFVGVGGDLAGAVNPDLKAHAGDTIRVVLINDDGLTHDLALPDLGVQTPLVASRTQASQVVFQLQESGEFVYYCTIAGHRQAGMEGRLIVEGS